MKERFYRFMQGRYGVDSFSKFLECAALVCVILSLVFHNVMLDWIVWILLLYVCFRTFSRNYQARYAENRRFLDATAKFRYWFDQQRKLAKERKYHHIYTCPKCRQKIRIPKGKGKIMVRCPKCRHEFQKRS